MSKTTDPKRVGVPPGPDPVIEKYKAGVAERAKAEAAKRRVPMPNLSTVDQQFDPKKDEPMTLAQMGQAQQNVDQAAAGDQKPQLSSETARGLQALQQQATVARAEQPTAQPSDDEDDVDGGKQPHTQKQLQETLEDSDDLELEMMLAKLKQDLINNESQRKIIDARVKPMDLADGIASGEFKQLVPIKPGSLEVQYRSVSPMENEHLRRLVIEMRLEDERMADLSVDRLSLMQTVAAIVHINGQPMPTHIENPGTLSAKFLDDVFRKKYAIISGYPAPMIHALTTHCYWFDQRVRALFSMDAVKNG